MHLDLTFGNILLSTIRSTTNGLYVSVSNNRNQDAYQADVYATEKTLVPSMSSLGHSANAKGLYGNLVIGLLFFSYSLTITDILA